MKHVIFIIISAGLLLGAPLQAQGGSLSLGLLIEKSFHNENWFYFNYVPVNSSKTGTVDLSDDFYWTLPGLEVKYQFHDQPSLSLSVRGVYQYNTFTIRDTAHSSYDRWVKENRASWHYFSLGATIRFPKLPLKPYLTIGGGIVYGNLSTSILFEMIDESKDFWIVEGDGTANFLEGSLGFEKTVPFLDRSSVFFELGYRHTVKTLTFDNDTVYGDDTQRNRRISGFDRQDIGIGGPYARFGIRFSLR